MTTTGGSFLQTQSDASLAHPANSRCCHALACSRTRCRFDDFARGRRSRRDLVITDSIPLPPESGTKDQVLRRLALWRETSPPPTAIYPSRPLFD